MVYNKFGDPPQREVFFDFDKNSVIYSGGGELKK